MTAAREKQLVLDKPEQFDSASGIGVRGTVADKALALGNPQSLVALVALHIYLAWWPL